MTGTPLNFDEIETVKILRADGMTYHAISLEIGRDPKTVKKACLEPKTAEEIKEIKAELASEYEDLARRLLTSITDNDIEKINCYQRVISSGIATDKMRLLRNESTENISIDAVNERLEDRRKRGLELEKRIQEFDAKRGQRKLEALECKTDTPKQDDEN